MARRVCFVEVGKAKTTPLPRLRAVVLGVGCRVDALVIVDNQLLVAHTAFTGQEYRSASTLQHRQKIGDHIALGVEILDRLPEY